MARTEKTIFISYRRKDISWALAVYQYLTSQKYDVFFDFSSLSSGDFEQVIISNIRARAHFLLILTPTALDRCSEPGDWLRREIETAVDDKRNIIPLFFDGFNFGSPAIAEKLTGRLAAITRYNGLEIPPGYFIEAMERLSERYLNVPLNAVIHPVSTEVRKVVKEEQLAVNEAVARKWEDIKDIFKPAKGSYSPEMIPGENPGAAPLGSDQGRALNLRRYGIGVGVLVLVLAGIIGINAMLSNSPGGISPTATRSITTNTRSIETSVPPEDTATAEIETSTATLELTVTLTPSPTPGIGSTLVSAKDGMSLLFVPAGEFLMGNNAGESDERPAHTVILDAFWIDETEVTNQMYSLCVQQGECQQPRGNEFKSGFENHPVANVDWFDAVSYCTWTGKRLPTEAEWEKAASWDSVSQSKRLFPWGEGLNCTFANYYDTNQSCMGATTAVRSYPKGKSPYKVFDMAGNVSEWVHDWYMNAYYEILEDPTTDPSGPENGDLRVVRGGSWFSYNSDVRATERYYYNPVKFSTSIGFRCAMDASE